MVVRLLSQCISWPRVSPCHYAQLTSELRIPLYLLSFPFLARLIVASQGFIILPPWHFGLAFACAAILHASIHCLPPFSAPSYALIACRMTARESWPRCHDISVPIVSGLFSKRLSKVLKSSCSIRKLQNLCRISWGRGRKRLEKCLGGGE